jgi:hypothetical protein
VLSAPAQNLRYRLPRKGLVKVGFTPGEPPLRFIY